MTDDPRSTSSHGDRVRAFYDAWNRRDWAAVASRLAPEVEWFNATRRELVRGVDAVVALLKSSADAFPDARIDVQTLRSHGDLAMIEWSVRLEGSTNASARAVSEVQVFDGDRCVRATSHGDVITMLLEDRESVAPDVERIVVDLPKVLPLPRTLKPVTSLGPKRSTIDMPALPARAS